MAGHRGLGCAIALAATLAAAPAWASGSGGGASEDAGQSSALDRARGSIEAENYGLAVERLNTLLPAQADNADVHNLLGYALRKQGKLAEAEAAYDRALELDPEHRGALEYKGELHVRRGELDEARDLLSRLDEACGLFGCEEYEELQKVIKNAAKDS